MNKPVSLINQDVLKNLLLLCKYIGEGNNGLAKALGTELPFIGEINSRLNYIILDYIGVPPDTTLCYIQNGEMIKRDPSSEKCRACTGCFCRDWFDDTIYEFENGQISLDEILDILLNWKKHQQE